MAQVNLAEATAYDLERCLPSRGTLCLFFDYALFLNGEEYPWNAPLGSDAPNALNPATRVLWIDAEVDALTPRRAPPGVPELPEALVRPACEWTRDIYDEPPVAPVEPGQASDPLDELEDACGSGGLGAAQGFDAGWPLHRLLGHLDPVQDCPVSPCSTLLFQIDHDPRAGLEWGDAGRLYTIVSRDWLAERAFEKLEHGFVLMC